MLRDLIKIAQTYPSTRNYLVPLIRTILADEKTPLPWGFQKFLDQKKEGGKVEIANPNPETREQFPRVQLNTALDYEVGGKKPVWEKTLEEYKAWLKGDPEEPKTPKIPEKPKTPPSETESVAPSSPGNFTKKIIPSNDSNWKWEGSILNAKTIGGVPLSKFSWNPVTGEFLLVWPSQHHATTKGKAPFDDYVRGIILRDKKTVAFRPFRPTWLKERERSITQQFHGEGGEHKAIMNSMDAQDAAAAALKDDGATGWSFRQNISNKQLEDETGERGW